MSKISVFTPTFNRGYIIKRCYESLVNQTCKDFIWLVVDDGSTDETSVIIEGFIMEKKINIKYIKQANKGKQAAVNTGILNTTTEYFSFLDSDDYYHVDTVKKFIDLFEKIDDNPKVAGIMARRGDLDGNIIGTQRIVSDSIVNYNTLIRMYNFHGDTCRAYKVSVLKDFLYPKINEKFILESAMFSKIDRLYDLYIVNEVFSFSEYLADGYTLNEYELYKKNPLGFALGLKEIANSDRGMYYNIRNIVFFVIWCKKTKVLAPREHLEKRVLYLLCVPVVSFLILIRKPKWVFFD